MTQVQFVLDYRSPYSYLANTQMKTLGVPIDYEPVDIVAVMKQVNNQPSPMCPPKAKYAGADAARWARHYSVPFSPNRALLGALKQGQLKNALLSRAAIAAQQMGIFEQVNDALFGAVWVGTDDLVSNEGRAQFLTSRGITAELWAIADSPDTEERLRTNSARAAERGVFGAPTFFVNGEMFFGNDRLAFVKASLNSGKMETFQ